jgi:hypothetical protein
LGMQDFQEMYGSALNEKSRWQTQEDPYCDDGAYSDQGKGAGTRSGRVGHESGSGHWRRRKKFKG